jgi:hypothetical protein
LTSYASQTLKVWVALVSRTGGEAGQNGSCDKQKTATKGPTEQELIIYVLLIAECVHSW